MSPLTQPFFLGSPQHADAVGGLPQPPYAAPEVVELAEVQPWRTSGGPRRDLSAWCVHGGVFRKLVRGDARSGEGFAAMHAAYAALAAVLPAAPAHLRLPRSVRLLFGLHEVLVEMPAVAGRAAGEEEVRRGALLPPLARAIAWLARQRLVYTDLRGPNVIVDALGDPWLVDFDDCVLAPAPVTTLEGYMQAVGGSPGAQGAGVFAASLGGGLEVDLEGALREAFAEAAEAQPPAGQ